MPRPRYRYPWPASALTPQDMAVLHGVRETSAKRVHISALVANAVRACYGQAQPQPPQERKEA